MPIPTEIPTVIGTVKTIDSKGRITLPEQLLQATGLKHGDEANVIVYEGAVVIRKMVKSRRR